MKDERAIRSLRPTKKVWLTRMRMPLLIVLLVLIGARLALPWAARRMVNDRLNQIPGYSGEVDDVTLHLWRGAYSFHGFRISKLNGRMRKPFFHADQVDFSLAWRELWRRKIVSEIIIRRGELNFVKGPSEAESQTDLDKRWQDAIADIFPISITYLEVTDGLLRYVDTTRRPEVNVFVTHMKVVATGLRNRPGEGEGGDMPAQITVEGDSLGAGQLKLLLTAEPLAAEPHFHLSLKLDNVNLPALNESLRAYANVDVSRGTFRLVAEMAGRDGGFQGYVKPFFENLDFHNQEDKDKGIGSRVWEHIVAGVAWLVKNKSRDQVATRIPFQGRFGDAKYGLWVTIMNLFHHGFVHAFDPSVEGSVHAGNIKPDGESEDGTSIKDNVPPNRPIASPSTNKSK